MADGVSRGAEFSPCRLWRYSLWRVWNPEARPFVVIGLNPSTADETQDDPTIRRCINFAKREGCGRLLVLNLFAFRSTDPAALRAITDPVGPENDAALRYYTTKISRPLVVAAWGVHGALHGRGAQVMREILAGAEVYSFGRTQDGNPRHPLYLRIDSPLTRYVLPESAPNE